MYMKIRNFIYDLTSIYGVSTDESGVSARAIEMLEPFCDTVSVDHRGNVIGTICADVQTDKTLMIEAHLDSIGLMVSKIDNNGYVEFVSIGGVDERILVSEEVIILGEKETNGIIFSVLEDKDKNPRTEQMRIDTGINADELKSRIKPGDLIVIKSDTVMLCGNTMSSAAMDNRAGIASILHTLENIDKSKMKYNLTILFSVEEELGLHGAYSGTEALSPDAALVIDVTHGITPDSKDETGVFPLGCGAVICRGPNLDYKLTKRLISLANDNSIPYKIEVVSGHSGTDAWATQICGGGVLSMLVSIPLKYMHSNVETLDLSDVYAVSQLVKLAAEGGISLD